MDKSQHSMKTLILAEKPSVARDIAKGLRVTGRKNGYLESSGYIITWAIGHLLQLCEPQDYDPKWQKWDLSTLPIIPGQTCYKPIPKTQKQLGIVRKLLNRRDIDKVVIATDAGREGEVIARTIIYDSGVRLKKSQVFRLWTSQALTPEVVRAAMANLRPSADFDRLWYAGQARQIADWLIGMNGTRAASLRLGDLFSVGRVQTAVLSLLVDRRREREQFRPTTYYTVQAELTSDKGQWGATWFDPQTGKTAIDSKGQAEQIASAITNKGGSICDVKRQRKKQAPPLLYSLTELQRAANARYDLSAQQTLSIAQKLYEEYKCISYPRTDSQVLGTQNVDMVKALISQLTKSYPDILSGVEPRLISLSNKRVFNDKKLTDHHAIIPLRPLPSKASTNEQGVYDLIIRRFAAAFYPDCEYEQVVIITDVEGHHLRTRGKIIHVPGWQLLYPHVPKTSGKGSDEPEQERLPDLAVGDPAHCPSAQAVKRQTSPPAEYTDASLLRDMSNPARYVEDAELQRIFRGDVGLGTQATRAGIIEILVKRGYAVRKKKTLQATDKGCLLVDSIRQLPSARRLADAGETAKWERHLEEISQGKGDSALFLSQITEFAREIVRDFVSLPASRQASPCPKGQHQKKNKLATKKRKT